MSKSLWSNHMNEILLEKLATMDKTITPEELEAQGIVALKDATTGQIQSVRWLKKFPTKADIELKRVIPIFQKEPKGLVSTD